MSPTDERTSSAENALAAALRRLLAPVVRILLRYGISYRTFSEIAKKVFVDVASRDFALPDRKTTTSRVSVITGLTRREVARLTENTGPSDADVRDRHNRVRRLISGWTNDEKFLNKRKRPMSLTVEGDGATFATLVRLYGNDVPLRAALDELVRLGVVDRTADNRVRLIAPAYIPAKGEVDKIEMLGSDVADLVMTIEHNLVGDGGKPMYQRKVVYDDLPAEVIDALRASANARAQKMLEDMGREMRRHDRGTARGTDGTGRKRLVLGVYVREESLDEDEER